MYERPLDRSPPLPAMLSLEFGWRDLLFANWRVAPETVAKRLPDSLAVETFDGSAWLTVVPFVNVDTRPRWLPAAVGRTIPELNLRTYVTAGGEPGVYFFSLDAASLAATIGARLTHRLPYYYARMDVERDTFDRTSTEWDRTDPPGARIGGPHRSDGASPDPIQAPFPRSRVTVRSRRLHPGARPAAFAATYEPRGDPFVPENGSLAGFLTERRRLYTESQDGRLRYTDVAHDPWTLYEADVTVEENTLFEANRFARPEGEPVCYYSPGVTVVTSRSRVFGEGGSASDDHPVEAGADDGSGTRAGEVPRQPSRRSRGSTAGPAITSPSTSNREP